MQKKTSDYTPRVNTKLVNCNLNFVTGPFYYKKNTYENIMKTIKTYDIDF